MPRLRTTSIATLVVAVAAPLLLGAAADFATPLHLPVVGEGKAQRLDPSAFPEEQRKRYDLFATRCTKCHPMARPIAAITTRVAPVTGSEFTDEYVKKYVVKMMRKPNSGISKEDAREIIYFLRWALEVEHAVGEGGASRLLNQPPG